jgi:hypothetical protein
MTLTRLLRRAEFNALWLLLTPAERCLAFLVMTQFKRVWLFKPREPQIIGA